MTLRAAEIARLLGQPPPTPEQEAVIEAGLHPLLVVAGAGSGKTETMAARVVYLVANGLVESDRVIGLTFTRKAAAELSRRMTSRLTALADRAHGRIPPLPGMPTVSTYNSYAAGLVAEHGLRIGVEPGSALIGEAALWLLVTSAVEHTDADLATIGTSPGYLAQQVVSLLGQCCEHLVSPADVAGFGAGFEDFVAGLPGSDTAQLRRVVKASATRTLLTRVVAQVTERKRDTEVMDFADQVAFAARLAQLDDVALLERDRFGVVLLDEYQDTSVAQLRMLSGLFGRASGHPVTAVGDPHQSIYGWRGASAGNLESFPDAFARSNCDPADVVSLATSWRNDAVVLDLANAIARPLAALSRVPVPTLDPRPGAQTGELTIRWHETLTEETDALADDLAGRWHRDEEAVRAGSLAPEERQSIAVLSRRRRDFPQIEAALRARGLPVRVFGLGGLLDRPEVGDIVATLAVLADPTRGEALIRLLTGPRWRIGPRDLRALAAWAQELDRAAPAAPADETMPTELSGDRVMAGPHDVGTTGIIEGLDALPAPQWRAANGAAFSETGYRRLHRLSRELARLRRRTDIALPELVSQVERVVMLDVELAARPGIDPLVARSQLDEFFDVAADFADSLPPGPNVLPAFLAWLDAAAQRERGLDLGDGDPDEVQDDSRVGQEGAQRREVHLLTVHAAKGLEWDVVAVPCLVEGGFPHVTVRADGETRDAGWTTDAGLLPYPLRGDAANLPHWRLDAASDVADLARELEDFKRDCGAARVREERRLAYVAFTRPRHALILSGSWWRDGKRQRVPSRFLTEIVRDFPAASMDDASRRLLAGGSSFDTNPLAAIPETAPWPNDPFAGRRDGIVSAARAVRDAMAEPHRRTRWSAEVDRLLRERDLARDGELLVDLPAHLSASRAVALARDPAALALAIRRPVPSQPRAATRRGTAFHAWLEQRLQVAPLVELDDLPGASDDDGPDVELEQLQAGFLRSGWADRRVVAVEVDVETPVAGTILRGRVDAVFARDDGGVDIVDWKTGRPPSGAEDLRAAAIQLAVYRVAWSRLHDVAIEKVHASFCYVAHAQTISPVDGMGEADLVALLHSVPTVPGEPGRESLGAAPQGGERAGVLGSADTPGPAGPSSGDAAGPPRRRRRVAHTPAEGQGTLFDG